MADKLDTVIGASIAGVVGIILICSMVIPIATQQIYSLKSVANIGDNVTMYTSLLTVVIIMLIVGLIIAIIRHYNGTSR